MRSLGAILSSCVLAAALSACGGGDGVSSKPISELTTEEAMDLCEDLNALAPSDEEFAQIVCRVGGIMAGEQGGDCQMTIEACLEDPPTFEPTDCSEQAIMEDPPPDCPEVTAGEVFDCSKAQINKLKEGANLTCEDSADGIFDLPPECTALMDECPELFEDGSAREVLSFEVLERALSETANR